MNLITAVTASKGAVVIVDDHFAAPDFDKISPDAQTAHYQFLNENPEQCKKLGTLLGIAKTKQGKAEVVTKAAVARAADFWEEFSQGKYVELLGPLLNDLKEENLRNRQYIDELVRIVRAEFGVDPLTFVSLEEAREALKECAIAFLDYFIDEKVAAAEAVIAHHKTVKTELAVKFNHEGKAWPKAVFLISSKLPNPTGLEIFRNEMGIKAAFFSTLEKKDIKEELLKPILARLVGQYPSAAQLNEYLEVLSGAVHDAASSVSEEIKRLELHDLTAVHWLRLDADSESISSYLSWLLSEALAVKFRITASQSNASLPSQDNFPLLDGKLFPRSVLFELFAEIAGGPVSENFDALPLGLGDVLQEVHQGAASRSLWLAISPACDLARCSADYEVLCVGGIAGQFKTELAEALVKEGKFYGKGRFVLKHKEGEQIGYSDITWTPNQIRTMPVRTLKDVAKYKRIARLSELFTQEVKELALSNASRIGTPVDPSFCVELNAVIRMRIKRGQNVDPIVLHEELTSAEYVPAVRASGRFGEEKDGNIIMFSIQFHDWILAKLDSLLGVYGANEKVTQLRTHFLKEAHLRVQLNPKGRVAPIDKLLTISYAEQAPAGNYEGDGMEISLYPYSG